MSARKREATGATQPGKAKAAASARKASRCPICGKPVVRDFRPFCSKRCANIDLGRWLEGRYAVPGESIARETVHEPAPEDDEDVGC